MATSKSQSADSSKSSASKSSDTSKSVDTSSGPSAEELGSVGEQPQTYDKPKAQEAAEKAAGKRAEEVKEQQLAIQRDNLTNVPPQPTSVVYGREKDEGKTPDSAVFGFDGSTVTLTTTAREIEFGREEFLGLLRAATKIGAAL